jgi:hypothetical protein
MNKRKIPLHKLPEYFIKWFEIRQLNLHIKNSSILRLKTDSIIATAKTEVCDKLSLAIDACLTETGKRIVLAELKELFPYDIIEITFDQAVVKLKSKRNVWNSLDTI